MTLDEIGLAARAGRAVRPRRLVAAAGRRAAGDSPIARTRPRHADGSTTAASPPRTFSTPTPRRTWPGCCASTARSASPAGSRPPSYVSAVGRIHLVGATRRARPRRYPRSRPSLGRQSRPNAPFRRCASRSTASSTLWPGRCRPPSRPWPCTGALSCFVPVTRGPAGQAVVRGRRRPAMFRSTFRSCRRMRTAATLADSGRGGAGRAGDRG